MLQLHPQSVFALALSRHILSLLGFQEKSLRWVKRSDIKGKQFKSSWSLFLCMNAPTGQNRIQICFLIASVLPFGFLKGLLYGLPYENFSCFNALIVFSVPP